MEYILETCCGVKEVDVTACSNGAVDTRARAAFGLLALDLFALLRSLGEGGERYSFSNLDSVLASPPLLLFDPALAPCKNALFQATAHGTDSDVVILLSLSFVVGDKDLGDERRVDSEIRTYDANEKDSQDNAPLLLVCRSGNLEMAEILLCANVGVGAANKRGDTPLLAAVGTGKLGLPEMLISKGANVNVANKRGDTPGVSPGVSCTPRFHALPASSDVVAFSLEKNG
jgi:hypothetical protein